jgi:hypothetical protein
LRFLKKLKIYLPYDPAVLLMGIYPEEITSAYQRDTCKPVFVAAPQLRYLQTGKSIKTTTFMQNKILFRKGNILSFVAK